MQNCEILHKMAASCAFDEVNTSARQLLQRYETMLNQERRQKHISGKQP